jgi:hypothetical protein
MEAGGLSSPWVLGRLHLTSRPTHLNVKDRRKPGSPLLGRLVYGLGLKVKKDSKRRLELSQNLKYFVEKVHRNLPF